jgi:hypothetical protein
VPASVDARTDTGRVVAPTPTYLRSADVVIATVGVLAERGAEGRTEALGLALAALPTLRMLTLRTADGSPVSVTRMGAAGELRWALDVPVRGRGGCSGVLSAVSCEPLTTEEGALLRAVADALALTGGDGGLPPQAAAQALLDAEADLALVAAELEETVVASIVALRHTEPDLVRAAATASLAEVRRIGRRLRAQALGDGLRAALADLREWGATVYADAAALDDAAPAVAVLVERVAQAACRSADGKVQIWASGDDQAVKLTVESADNEIDASEVERWRRRAHALHGELRHWAGGVELILPAATGNEGRHDDGLDL